MQVRKAWIVNLRVLATISVVFLHSSSVILYKYGQSSNFNWWVGNICDSIARFCVPVFVMITGSLLLPLDIDHKLFWLKRFKKIVIPFFFWSAVYVLYSYLFDSMGGEDIRNLITLQNIFNRMLLGPAYHLWYIYMLLGLYIFIPLLSKWIRNSTENQIIYLLIIWSASLFVNYFCYECFLIPVYFIQYMGYLVLGYYLSVTDFKNKFLSNKILPVLLYITGFLITAIGTYFTSSNQKKFDETFYRYLTPNLMVEAMGVFLLLKPTQITKHKSIVQLITLLDKYSYGIYLIHMIVLSLWTKKNVTAYAFNPIVGIPLITICCLTLSTWIIYLINKLPFGKYISG